MNSILGVFVDETLNVFCAHVITVILLTCKQILLEISTPLPVEVESRSFAQTEISFRVDILFIFVTIHRLAVTCHNKMYGIKQNVFTVLI